MGQRARWNCSSFREVHARETGLMTSPLSRAFRNRFVFDGNALIRNGKLETNGGEDMPPLNETPGTPLLRHRSCSRSFATREIEE